MELLDRYLHAVKFWLPKGQREDIIAELSEDLRTQIEEKETEAGRQLTRVEVVAFLKQVGRPVLVANRYLPQRYLIGPVWFPIYTLVLKIVAACYLVPWILVWIGLTIFAPSRVPRSHAGWLGMLGAAWGGFWLAAFMALGTVTIVFAVLERAQAQSGLLENWDPGKLPAVRDRNRIPRGNSIAELVANVVFCSWWATAMRSTVVFDRPHVQITLAPVWPFFFWAFLLLALINIALAGVNLLRPYWTRPRAAVRLLENLAGSVLLAAMLRSHIVASGTVVGVSTEKMARIVDIINRVVSQGLPIIIAVAAVILVVDVYRIVRVDPGSRPRTASSKSAILS